MPNTMLSDFSPSPPLFLMRQNDRISNVIAAYTINCRQYRSASGDKDSRILVLKNTDSTQFTGAPDQLRDTLIILQNPQ